MRTLSRALRRIDMLRAACVVLGATWIALAGAYVFADALSGFGPGAALAAAAALAIAGAGFLYAWREPALGDR